MGDIEKDLYGKKVHLPGYDYLAVAIIEQTVSDYMNSYKRLEVLRERLANCENEVIRPQKPNEPNRVYRSYVFRHTKEYYENEIMQVQLQINHCINFFKGNWFSVLTEDLDGEILLKKCNKQLKKEGFEIYEVNR